MLYCLCQNLPNVVLYLRFELCKLLGMRFIIVDMFMLFIFQSQVKKGWLCKRGKVFLVVCKV
jgi:hypothetical protein